MSKLVNRVSTLRRSFETGFSRPAEAMRESRVKYVAVEIAGKPFAIRISQLAELQRARKIVRIPIDLDLLWGVTSVRGEIVPVYGLGALLGEPEPFRESPWLAIVRAEAPVALAFSEFKGQIEAGRSDMAETAGSSTRFSRVLIRGQEIIRQVIDIPEIIAEIRERIGTFNPKRED